MTASFTLFAAGLGACLILTPLIRFLAARCGLVDHPDAHRKMHVRPVPVAGGIAILLSVCAGVGMFWLGSSFQHDVIAREGSYLVGLLLAAVVIGGVGVLDDCG